MSLILALLVQAEFASPPPPTLIPIDFDLARYRSADFGMGGCDRTTDPSAITVCARRNGGGYPLARMERLYGPQHIVADISIAGNLRGGIQIRRVDLNLGQTGSALPTISNRITVGVRLPF